MEHFGDFELVFEWKISPKGNSGVKYRVQDRAVLVSARPIPTRSASRTSLIMSWSTAPATAASSNPAIPCKSISSPTNTRSSTTRDTATHLEVLTVPAGAIYSMVAPTSQVAKPVGEFNESRIVLRGAHVEHWLNGVKLWMPISPPSRSAPAWRSAGPPSRRSTSCSPKCLARKAPSASSTTTMKFGSATSGSGAWTRTLPRLVQQFAS